jgi:hypothetical protein
MLIDHHPHLSLPLMKEGDGILCRILRRRVEGCCPKRKRK